MDSSVYVLIEMDRQRGVCVCGKNTLDIVYLMNNDNPDQFEKREKMILCTDTQQQANNTENK